MPCTRGCCETQAEHYRSIAFGASATPGRRAVTVEKDRMEARWHKDMPAYKRLRQDGLQPPAIDGCSTLEAGATHKKQIEMGALIDEKKIRTADTMSADLGLKT